MNQSPIIYNKNGRKTKENRIISLVLAILMVLSLTACGEKPAPTEAPTAATTEPTAAPTEAATEAPTEDVLALFYAVE